MRWRRYVGIDYSGAGKPTQRLPGLQLYADGERVAPEGGGNWSRAALAERLVAWLGEGEPMIIGIDHALGFPESYLERHRLADWPAFLEQFVRHWPTDREPVAEVRRRVASPKSELRLTDRFTTGAKSVFQFDVQGSVATSTHAGLPWIGRLRAAAGSRLHCWPFDGWQPQPGVSLLAEVFPSLLRQRYPRDDRTVDQQDAYAVSRWLGEMERRGELDRFLEPPLDRRERAQARREGWILGVT